MDEMIWLGFLTATIRMATPLLLAALGEIYAERAGLLNIALEGMMLFGAFSGFVASHESGSPWIGLLGAMAGGVAIALLFALLTVTLNGDQTVVGIAINLVAVGLSTFLHRVLYGVSTVPVMSVGFAQAPVPVLERIPVLGPVLFQHTPLTYLAFLLIPLVSWSLWRTPWGLRLRACGENPIAARSEGVPVRLQRYSALVLSGTLAGMGGAFLTLDQLNLFVDDITAGRGFIALAVVIFGHWRPLGAALAAVLFGAAEALGLTFQVRGLQVSHYLLLMLPYILTIMALVGQRRRSAAPAALGRPLPRES